MLCVYKRKHGQDIFHSHITHITYIKVEKILLKVK